MPEYDVVILTDSRYENPSNPGGYVQNILTEDRLVIEALQDKGLRVDRISWSNPYFEWSSTRSLLFRTTWDYFDKFKEFRKWLNEVQKKTILINSPELINWNVDKQYLAALNKKGVNTVPTRFVARGTGISLEELHTLTGWDHTVLKPTVGGGGRYTYALNRDNISIISRKLKSIMKEEDFMLQPFQYSITERGEWSYMFFGETYSHAVLKKAREGDFRVQDDFGGTIQEYAAEPHEISFAKEAVMACPEIPVYSRVDVLVDNEGALAVSEVELIEPELWFRIKPEAAELMASGVIQKLNNLN